MSNASRFLVACAAGVFAAAASAPAASPEQDIDTLVQQGLQTAQAQMTADADGATPTQSQSAGMNTFSFGDFGVSISFTFPEGFPQGAVAEVLPRMAIQDPVDPEYPEHARIILTGYAGESRSNTAPGIRVFRVDQVNAMDPAIVARLEAVLAGTSEDRFDFPLLPFAGRTVDAQARTLDFGNGAGYRFLVQGSFDASTLRGTRLYYVYQGLTADGKYIVSVLLQPDAPFIEDLATGEPFTSHEVADAYVITLNARINAAQPADFAPSLEILDGLVRSLKILEQ